MYLTAYSRTMNKGYACMHLNACNRTGSMEARQEITRRGEFNAKIHHPRGK